MSFCRSTQIKTVKIMPQNLELKTKIDSIKKKQKILEEIGAEFIEVLNQKDIYYECAQGLLKMRSINEREELIFYNRNESGGNRFSNYEILDIASKNGAVFLSKIFNIEVIVEKKRLLYIYDNTRIHLDEVKKLGEYLELETLIIKDEEEAMERFDKIVRLLQLDLNEQIRSSYSKLLIEQK